MIPLGEVRLARARRPWLGQEPPSSTLTTVVMANGAPLPGVLVEYMYMDGSTDEGMTDADGKVQKVYGQAQLGQAVVRITPPEGFFVGEDNVKGVDLKGSPELVAFDLGQSDVVVPGTGLPPVASGIDVKGAAVAVATVAAMTLIGLNV